ncbi:FlgB family protein [Pontitalea aquivivens]|uniref:FlgB family protein n=1 Tax=Pontitalea aquivivens TaxID=3388663 RepID=UPI0039709F4D
MFEKLEIMQMAQAMARHAALRQNAVAQNIANADTPGYVARDAPAFSETYQQADGRGMQASRPGHVGGADRLQVAITARREPGVMSPDGNSVSLESEMVKGIEVKRQHDLALAVYKSSLNLLRASLGKG